MPILKDVQIQPVTFPLRFPFITASGQKVETHNLQVILTLSNGIRGYGEASSSIAMAQETPEAMRLTLTKLTPYVRGKKIADYRTVIQSCWQLQPFHPTAVAALECAILDAYTRVCGKALYQFLGGAATAVETDLTLSIGDPRALRRQAKAAAAQGFRKFKVKLAGDSAVKDMERIQAVVQAVPKAIVVADGNQGLQLSQTLDLMKRLEKKNLSLYFLEQPFPKHDIPAMRLFRKRCKTPLFVDESVLTAEDANRIFGREAADGINIKVAKSGLLGALDIIQVAKHYKKRVAIGCMEESKLGLAASVHLACGTGVFDWVDLDSVFLLEKSTLRGGFTTQGPKLSVQRIRSGIGIR